MKATIFVLALAAAAAPAATAGTIFNGLFNTGVDSSSNAYLNTSGQTDSHFTTGSGYYAATYYYGVPWYPDQTPGGPGGADWISTYANGTIQTYVGSFDYTETLTANVTGSVIITGNWATDNCGTIDWNGLAVSGTGTTIGGGVLGCTSPSSAFTALTSFSITESVTYGTTYLLDFQVYNSGGPTGLLVTGLAAECGAAGCTYGPEPSPVWLTLTGFVLLGIGTRRRWAGNRTCIRRGNAR
jgi:hypothetical protein